MSNRYNLRIRGNPPTGTRDMSDVNTMPQTNSQEADETISEKKTKNSPEIEAQTNLAALLNPEIDIMASLNRLEGTQNMMIKEVLSQMNSLISQLQKTNTYLLDENTDLKKDLKSIKKRLDLSEGLITTLHNKVKQQNESILDLQCRSMRDNLVFTGLPAEPNENPETTLKSFLSNKMKVPNATKITFDRVHRSGPPSRQNRPIIAKLNPSSNKGLILSCGKNLRGTDFRVFEQLPQEVQERRKRLMPEFKKFKSDPSIKKVSWSVEKLIVDGRIHTAADATLNLDSSHANVVCDIEHGPQINEGGSTFQAHCADVHRVEDVQIVMANLLQNKSLANATHNIFAYRIGNQFTSRDGLNDDGEHGGARKIMEVMEKNNIDNKMVIVTRWYGGSHIGQKRFEAIENCTKNIIKIQ